VTGFDGDVDEMPTPPLDDRALEALLSGAPSAQSGFDWLLPFVEDLEKASREPAPVVQPALARLLSEGFSPELGEVLAARPPARRKRRLTAKAAGLGFALVAVGATAAGAAGVLPDPAQHAVATVVEATTPFSFPDKADDAKATAGSKATKAGNDPGRPTGPAPNVAPSTSATAGATGAGANPGVTGLDRANQTPAAGNVPTSLPANAGRPAAPGSKGLGTAATTPAAGKAPATVPADTRPSPPTTDVPGAHGRNTASSTPAATRAPARP
jgi:hypothetical protein